MEVWAVPRLRGAVGAFAQGTVASLGDLGALLRGRGGDHHDDYARLLQEANPKCPSYEWFFFDTVADPSTCVVLTTTVTTTTLFLDCQQFCEGNSQPWFQKCGWTQCTRCYRCQSVVVPNPPAPAPAPLILQLGNAPAPSSPGGSPSATGDAGGTGGTGGTGGSATGTGEATSGDSGSEAVATGGGTAGTAVTGGGGGEQGGDAVNYCVLVICNSVLLSWVAKCTWTDCSECPMCYSTSGPSRWLIPTTTVTVVTTVLETTTNQNTTITTQAMELPVTYTTTTTVGPCALPATFYPTGDCQRTLDHGAICPAAPYEHPCVEQGTLRFECPATNSDREALPNAFGRARLRCRVCGILNMVVEDTDIRLGHIALSISWGPNFMEGHITEDIITGYAVVLVDGCHRRMDGLKQGGILTQVAVRRGADQISNASAGCCLLDAYSAQVTAELPEIPEGTVYGDMSLMVVPVTTLGLLSVGPTTDPFVDRGAGDPVLIGNSGAPPSTRLAIAAMLPALLFLPELAIGVVRALH